MSFINYPGREVNYKIVYCGPGLSGKTTNVLQIARSTRPELRGRLVSLYTSLDRTLYFDFLPVELGIVRGFKVRFHIYSVPGQVFYAASRRLVLRGADGVIFVADSTIDRHDANIEAIRDFKENMAFYDLDIEDFPYVLQLNKRDMDNIVDAKTMTDSLRIVGEPVYQAVASKNEGVQEPLKDVVRQILHKYQSELEELSQAGTA